MADIAIFVTVRTVESVAGTIGSANLQAQFDFLQSNSSIKAIEIYRPEVSSLHKTELVPAPQLIVQIDIDNVEAANALVRSAVFKALLIDPAAYSIPVASTRVEITESIQFPLSGKVEPVPRQAPVSFVVRYYGPVRDSAEFVRFYTRNHAPILSRFPGIRNVLCYLPIGWELSTGIPHDQLVIGNEVVFDNQQALLDALETDVLVEAKEDSKLFQPFGYSTHHVMRREQILRRVAEDSPDVQ